MPKRPYKKKNMNYWNGLNRKIDQPPTVFRATPTVKYEWDGDESFAHSATAAYRDSFSPNLRPVDRFKNINAGLLPWDASDGLLNIHESIVLVQRAYANVAIFRNAVESAVEFSNSNLHIKTDNKTVRDFFTEWFNRINIFKIKDNWFRMYYREGQAPMYKFMGKMSATKFGQMKSAFGAKSDMIPIRYVSINPAQLYLENGIGYGNTYLKVLSPYEIQRLKTPKTPEDKQIFESLPNNVKKQIVTSTSLKNIYIPLDPKRLSISFYKKQDYEPMAIPLGYPILNDIEWKLELKQMDRTISKTVEHVILLITTGEPVDQYGGGINVENLTNLQNIFRNQTLGRVLVADYTTKGEWLIPPIGDILGPQKYEQVEKDIREGLQAIFVGDDKFANASMKAKIFTERMGEGQKIFLNDFLLPEIRTICEAMGFKNVPEIEFEQINLDDTSQRERVLLRLAELGILTPDEIFTAIESGVLPQKDENIVAQKEYKQARDKGMYLPLVGATKEQDGGEGRPGGSGTTKTSKKVGPIGTKAGLSMARIAEVTAKANRVKQDVSAWFGNKFNLKEFSPEQQSVVDSMAMAIVLNEPERKWLDCVASYAKTPKDISKDILNDLDNVAREYDLNDWEAAIVLKSKI